MDDKTREIAERLAKVLPRWWPGMRVDMGGHVGGRCFHFPDYPVFCGGDVVIGINMTEEIEWSAYAPDLDDPATLGVLIFNVLRPAGYKILWSESGADIGLACIAVLEMIPTDALLGPDDCDDSRPPMTEDREGDRWIDGPPPGPGLWWADDDLLIVVPPDGDDVLLVYDDGSTSLVWATEDVACRRHAPAQPPKGGSHG